MKVNFSLSVFALLSLVLPNVESAGLYEAVKSFKPCLDAAAQLRVNLDRAMTAPEDWAEKCFVACLAKNMGNVRN